MTFARRVFRIAAIYGVLVLFPMYFAEDYVGRTSPPPITHPEHFYGFIGVALAWQVLFWIISRDPVRFRPAMIAAILEKLVWGITCIVLYSQGRLASQTLGAGIIDLILGGLFVMSYRATAGASQELEPARAR